MPQTPSGKEVAGHKLGALLRAARGNRTQTELGARVGLSKSTVSRFESAGEVPDLEQARLLDEALGTGTMVRDAVRDILFNPSPGVLAIPRTFSTFVFQPSEHVGPVYVLLAAPADVIHDVRVVLSWGNKRRIVPTPGLDESFAFLDRHGLRVDKVGIALIFAKVGTDHTVIRINSNEPLMLMHGVNLPLLDDDRLLDANQGWLTV